VFCNDVCSDMEVLGHGFFSHKISAKSVTNTVNDFTKIFWPWKSDTKASGPEVSWHTIVGN